MVQASNKVQEIRLDTVLEQIEGTNLTLRAEGLKQLKAFFAKKADNLSILSDKAYHKIYEVIFKTAISEKHSLLSSKKNSKTTSLARLTACADVFRIVVRAGASKLKAKTLEAVVDHITETLPKADGEYCEPLAEDYFRALSAVLEPKANVERLKSTTWVEITAFCIQGINRYSDDSDGEPSGPGLGSSHISGSLTRSVVANGRGQSKAGSVSRQAMEDLLKTLLSLVSSPKAPILQSSEVLTDSIVRFLRSLGSAVSVLHQLAFSILNAVLSYIREDRTSLLQSIAEEMIPIISRFWQGKTISKDEMLNSVRDEMLILLFIVNLHLEKSVVDKHAGISSKLEDLLDVMRTEYARRADRDSLQLDDLSTMDFGASIVDVTPFRLHAFRLRPHSNQSERNWANLLVMGILQRLVNLADEQKKLDFQESGDEDQKHPRKRQRTTQSLSRWLGPTILEDENILLAGLQTLPFMLEDFQLSAPLMVELLSQLTICATDKRGQIASWALLAIASCTRQKAAVEKSGIDWLQLWHIGARALTFSATCRAAAVQLHSILAAGLVEYHEIGEDIDAMVTAADVSGPVALCDSAVYLMMHLLHARVTEVPGASLVSSQHVIRWIFARWNPTDRSLAALSAGYVQPDSLLDLLRVSLGLDRLPRPSIDMMVCGPVAQAWQQHLNTQVVGRYILLLEDLKSAQAALFCQSCPKQSDSGDISYFLDTAHFLSARKLILELLLPKLRDLLQNWKALVVDRSSVSTDTYRRGVNACILMLLLMPHFSKTTSLLQTFEEDVQALAVQLVLYLRDSGSIYSSLSEVLLQSIQPHLPSCDSHGLKQILKKAPHLVQFFVVIADELDRRRRMHTGINSGVDDDLMDLDDEFPTQQNQSQVEALTSAMPRQNLSLELSPASFYLVGAERLRLVAIVSNISPFSGSLPSTAVDRLLSLSREEFLLCRRLLLQVMRSDLIVDANDAIRVIGHIATILDSKEFGQCEVAQTLCLDILIGFGRFWSQNSNFAELASELYQWFFKLALQEEVASPEVQKRFSRLLLELQHLQIEPLSRSDSPIPSCRSILIKFLAKAKASVQFYIGNRLPELFELFILKDHDTIFLDVLDNLPSDAESLEGMAFRLFVFAKLASRWTTLLRRCIYHIFETPGRVQISVRHATKCMEDISIARKVNGPRELFALFAPQILYTWLESDNIEEMPYQIFGYSSLKDLLVDAQEEAVALMIMRGQEDGAEYLAKILDTSKAELLQKCFGKIMAYTVTYDMSTSPNEKPLNHINGEVRLRKSLGKDLFFECVNLHFVDTIAIFFNTIDHGDVEKHFLKKDELAYAGVVIRDIKSISWSNVILPPNQQPTFRAKSLTAWISYLCTRTQYQQGDLYTPALVTMIARKLLDSVHPALGPLHACSVLRKLRVLISLSGDTVLEGYPLEMLLQSASIFIGEPECADDAIGIVQYLLSRGSNHLVQSPSFVAGIALSILKSLRSFQAQQSTQNTQYRETMSRAQKFHVWMRDYASRYDSPRFRGTSRESFQALIQSAYKIGFVGNATTGTPESDLLFQLLQDEHADESLLSQSAREFGLNILCSEFQCPTSFRTDIFGDDELATTNAAVVWKSCKVESKNKQYLSWAGRVLGRAFAASGHIHQELLQESTLSQMKELQVSPKAEDTSTACLLNLLQSLTLDNDQRTVGLAESALRVIVTKSDTFLEETCKRNLSLHLQAVSMWNPYQAPPSETTVDRNLIEGLSDPFTTDAIQRPQWLRDLTIITTQFAPHEPVLRALVPILRSVSGFAERAFPFVLHLVLSTPSRSQQLAKKKLSVAFVAWFGDSQNIEKNNLKILINSILYLGTQPLPDERSIADRSRWLDIDYMRAASAATHCGMFRTALLYAEDAYMYIQQVPTKSSRRSSSIVQEVPDLPAEILLTIFQNIDDPDLYYGVPQGASLNTILARLEYEKDGSKSLAFRGAQYDSHLRRHDPESAHDAQSLVKALDVLSLSGLSHSLLQAQQTTGMSSASRESMFRTARKLEQWDLPVPSNSSNNAVTIYKAFQAIHNAPDYVTVLRAINEGFINTMAAFVGEDHGASALHDALQTLAALVEMDEVLSTKGSGEFEDLTLRFRNRSDWMKTGSFNDISQILSCRGTTLSALNQQPRLQKIINVSPVDTRLVEVQTALLASTLNRSHNALQESLTLATSLMDLINPCRELGLNLEAAIHVEAANALWDQGEMKSSIGMLQALDKGSPLKVQAIPVGRSDLLVKIGSQVSIARLEKPDRILQNYLKPALKELKGKNSGSEAGQVFHQFAVFCDQQLQDADGLEDLERLKKLRDGKADEVHFYSKMLEKARSPSEKTRYTQYLNKNRNWLKLDEEELQRHMSSRDEFLYQSLSNYLLALSASDDHDNNTLRFSALWLEHSEDETANGAVSEHLNQVPSRKFAPLMNQLTSRLQDAKAKFQQLLFTLVLRICTDHPFHGMYQIYAGANSRPNSKDETARSRHAANNKLTIHFEHAPETRKVWNSIAHTNEAYCVLAAEKDDKYKSNKRFQITVSKALLNLKKVLRSYAIPSPTMEIALAADLDYTKVPKMVQIEPQFSIASGVSAPKIITPVADSGAKFKQLVKGGSDDLRQDAIMEQVFAQVNKLLKINRSTRQRNLNIRTYKVLPLTSIAGIIEFVANTIPLHEYLMPAHERFYPDDLKGNDCRKQIGEVQTKSHQTRIQKYRDVTARFHPVMRYFFTEKFDDPDEWFVKRLAYTRSTAAISILGHVLGLGDRHGHNILLDSVTGEVVHIDLGVAFEAGRVLPVPELVPFRLTRDIVDGMGITKHEGVFRRCCEFTLEALRKEVYSIMTILDVLRYDPLYSWSISPARLAKLQREQDEIAVPEGEALAVPERTKERVNEPGEADRALTVVSKKLSKTLSVSATVNDLINEAIDEKNLAVLYSGWAAYA